MLPYNLESWLFFEFFFCMGNDKSRSKPSTKKYQNLPTASLFTPNRMLSSKGTWCVYLMEKLSNLIEEQHGSGGALYICRQQESQKANKSSSFNNVCPIITLITKEPLKKSHTWKDLLQDQSTLKDRWFDFYPFFQRPIRGFHGLMTLWVASSAIHFLWIFLCTRHP